MGTWYFAYGSLMWAPGFDYTESSLAILSGYERDMCMMSIDHRGTRARPGLVAGLRPAATGYVVGMAFHVAAERADEVAATLEARENSPDPCYEASAVDVVLCPDAASAARLCEEGDAGESGAAASPAARVVSARVFFPLASHWQYVPTLSDDEKVDILASEGRGRSGTSLEYLENLVASLAHRCGVSDRRLRDLMNRAKATLWQRSRVRLGAGPDRRTAEMPPDSEAAHGGSPFTPIFGRSVIAFSHMNEDARPELQVG
jgi:glutathione-specific gamma-glutamylcyclotransferase